MICNHCVIWSHTVKHARHHSFKTWYDNGMLHYSLWYFDLFPPSCVFWDKYERGWVVDERSNINKLSTTDYVHDLESQWSTMTEPGAFSHAKFIRSSLPGFEPAIWQTVLPGRQWNVHVLTCSYQLKNVLLYLHKNNIKCVWDLFISLKLKQPS